MILKSFSYLTILTVGSPDIAKISGEHCLSGHKPGRRFTGDSMVFCGHGMSSTIDFIGQTWSCFQLVMGNPPTNRWLVYHRQNPWKSHLEMDDDWGTPMTSWKPLETSHDEMAKVELGGSQPRVLALPQRNSTRTHGIRMKKPCHDDERSWHIMTG